ncbi:MAG: cupin domain-containing protein [Candidatus Nitrosotenuis sp.]
MATKKSGKFVRPRSKWVYPYKKEHPADKLKIRLMLNEKIKGDRIVGLRARIEPHMVHRLHTHKNEYVLVYSLGKCQVTVGTKTRTVFPHSLIFIPPMVPHRFYNRFSVPWEGIAFAIGTRRKIKNVWLE